MASRDASRARSGLRWLGAAVAVALLLLVVEPWLDQRVRGAEVRGRLAELNALCQSSYQSARQTLSRVDESRRESPSGAGSGVFAPLEPPHFVRSESGDPILADFEDRLLALEDDALRYRALVDEAKRQESGEGASPERAQALLGEAQMTLSTYVDGLQRVCAALQGEVDQGS